MSVKRLVRIAIFAAIMFVQEFALSFIPNVQLTVFLLVLYSKVFGLKKTCIIILIHTILDNHKKGKKSTAIMWRRASNLCGF